MTDQQDIIAVFGATGRQGGAVVDALLARGASVRALVRDPGSEKAVALAGRGVELAMADATEPSSVVAALRGVRSFFYMTTFRGPGGVEGETAQGIALADAAATAGVARLVFNSVGGAERRTGIPHFESKRRVEEHLERLGVPSVFIRPVFFMENLLFSGPPVEDGSIVVRMVLPDGVPLQLVAVRDIGIVSAEALLGADVPGGALEIAGDERTGSQLAEAFAQHSGLPARFEELPLSSLGADEDRRAMMRWFASPPAYQADFETTRALDPGLLDVPAWLDAIGWAPRG